MEKLQNQQESSQTPAEDGNAHDEDNASEGPITREQDIRNKLEYLGIPYSEAFLSGTRHSELQKKYEIFEWEQRQHMNKTLKLKDEILETVNIEILQYIHHSLLSRSSFRSRVKTRILLAELQGTPKGDPDTPAVIEQTRLELDYIRFAVSAEDLTQEERRIVTSMAMKIRKERIAKYGNPYKKGLKSNHEITPAPGSPFEDKSPTISKVIPNLIAHKMFKPSTDAVVTSKNPWEKLAEKPMRSVVPEQGDSTSDEPEDRISPLPISLGSSRKQPVHVTQHNRKARQKKARKMKQLAQTSPAPAETLPEPPANAASISQLCPHPHKKNYVTIELAKAFILTTHPDDPDIEAYRCRCGGIHLGHSSINNSSEKNRRKRQQEMEAEFIAQDPSTAVRKPTPHDVFRATQRQNSAERKDT